MASFTVRSFTVALSTLFLLSVLVSSSLIGVSMAAQDDALHKLFSHSSIGRSLLQDVSCSVPSEGCGDECNRRCSKTRVRKRCLLYCNHCCKKCLCVPPGTYGNKDCCPCYNDWKNHKGGPKCP